MKKQLLISVAFLIISVIGYSQTDKDTLVGQNQFVVNLSGGVQISDFNNLNTLLATNGFSTLNETNFSFGGGFYTLHRKSKVVSLFDAFTYAQTASNQIAKTKIKVTGVSFAFGYALINKNKIQLIPFAGIVASWMNTKMFSKIPKNTTAANFLSGTANQFEMTANPTLGNIGLQASFSPTIDKKTGDKLIFGIRTGYYSRLSTIKWKMDDTELKDSPTINPGGFYFNLIIGITI